MKNKDQEKCVDRYTESARQGSVANFSGGSSAVGPVPRHRGTGLADCDRCYSTRGDEIEATGKRLEWPETEVVPDDAVMVELPPDFGKLLGLAVPIVDRREARPALQGINLSRDGVTVTNGKELLNLPCPLKIPEDVTLPFSLVLLAVRPEGAGTLHVWRCRTERLFRIVIDGFLWQGKIQSGNFPD